MFVYIECKHSLQLRNIVFTEAIQRHKYVAHILLETLGSQVEASAALVAIRENSLLLYARIQEEILVAFNHGLRIIK